MLSFILTNIPFALGSVDSRVVKAGISIIILQTRKWKFRRYFQSRQVRKNRAKDLDPISMMLNPLLFEMEYTHLLHEPLKSPLPSIRSRMCLFSRFCLWHDKLKGNMLAFFQRFCHLPLITKLFLTLQSKVSSITRHI